MSYEENVIKKMQQAQLEIYKVFEALCADLGLPCFVTYGSGIGALRHGGFIPWDDDIDVGMLREDYDSLLKYLAEHPLEEYEMIAPETTGGCVLAFGKFSKKNTEYIEAAHSYRTYSMGVSIDINPFDMVSKDEKKRKKQIKWTWFWNRVMVLAEYKTPVLPEGLTGLKKSILQCLCTCIHYGLKLFGFTREKVYQKFLKHARMYEKENSMWYADFADFAPERTIIKKEEILPLVELPFEDTTITTVRNLWQHMTSLYGDFMKWPPEEERHNHPPKYVDFGDGVRFGEK